MNAWDFETRSRTLARYGRNQIPEDCTSQDWGITYDELEPYYDQFAHLYGVAGKAGNLNGEIQPGGNPFEGPRSREYSNPPSEQTCGSAFPQNSTNPPTGTVGALACWGADAIKDDYLKQPRALV